MTYLLRKLGFYLVALWAALTLNFVLPRLMPGNPINILQSKFQGHLSPAALHAFAVAFGLRQNQSFFAQYVDYLGQLLHGNLGISFTYYPQSVVSVLLQSAQWTLFLIGIATVLAFLIGTMLGIYSAWKRGTRFDSIVPLASSFMAALPHFWIALLLIYVFAFQFGWFPLAHAYSGTNGTFAITNWPSIFWHAVLPGFTLVVISAGGWVLSMRNNMITTIGKDYVELAQAKGLHNWRIMMDYAARNAILPNLTGFAMALGFVINGAVLIEVVFSYPGLGYALFQAVQNEDYPLLQGCLLLIALAVLLANFLVDLLHVLMDPQLRS